MKFVRSFAKLIPYAASASASNIRSGKRQVVEDIPLNFATNFQFGQTYVSLCLVRKKGMKGTKQNKFLRTHAQ